MMAEAIRLQLSAVLEPEVVSCARMKSGALTAQVETVDPTHGRTHRPVAAGTAPLRLMVLADDALARAEALDEARAAGEMLGPLHGVPIALKDLLYTKGLPTASGTRVMADFVPEEDATVVTRLKAAGAVVIGKTQLTEGAYGVHHPDIIDPVNPWAADRWTGVSSSGSGVAVAAGLCFGALGSDTGGSIRFPAASCGTVGVKPTYGRVSRHGAFPLAESLDHIGPMTRTVADAARMLQVMAGQDQKDATTLAAPVPNYGAEIGGVVQGLRIGIDWRYVTDGVEAPVVQAVRDALDRLTALGAEAVEFEMPMAYVDLVNQWGITCGVECARAHEPYYPEQKALYGPVLSELIELGRNPTRRCLRHARDHSGRIHCRARSLLPQHGSDDLSEHALPRAAGGRRAGTFRRSESGERPDLYGAVRLLGPSDPLVADRPLGRRLAAVGATGGAEAVRERAVQSGVGA